MKVCACLFFFKLQNNPSLSYGGGR